MSGRLEFIAKGWDKQLRQALEQDHRELRIICPFIKAGIADRLLRQGTPDIIEVITRFSLKDFHGGVSDTQALRLLLDVGAQIRGIRNLHAKLYLFGDSRTILTSANLTHSALVKNHEFGLVATDPDITATCLAYFDKLWNRAGKNLTVAKLNQWEQKLLQAKASGARPSVIEKLSDEGVNLGYEPEDIGAARTPSVTEEQGVANGTQAFVKFFGLSENDRMPYDHLILDEVKRAGCHWACAYPAKQRPRQPKDGDIIYMGRLVEGPNDIMVFGKAFALAHQAGRDDATAEEMEKRSFKRKWSRYIRVHSAEFLSGTMTNGVSLNKLMRRLGSDAFASTQRNAAKKSGNVNPRKAYSQKPAVMLSIQGHAWLARELEKAFQEHGRMPLSVREKLDWPKVPNA